MGLDDEATVRTIILYRSKIEEVDSKYHGRVVNSPADNILAELV
jgi:hypothetical protein